MFCRLYFCCSTLVVRGIGVRLWPRVRIFVRTFYLLVRRSSLLRRLWLGLFRYCKLVGVGRRIYLVIVGRFPFVSLLVSVALRVGYYFSRRVFVRVRRRLRLFPCTFCLLVFDDRRGSRPFPRWSLVCRVRLIGHGIVVYCFCLR